MVQARPAPRDGDEYDNFEHKLITFNAPGPEGAQQQWEGLLVQILSGKHANSDSDITERLRILHSDGLVRIWWGNEVSNVESVHPEPYSPEEIDFKVERSIFRGGTRQGNQLKGEALVDKDIEVWREMSRGWQKAKVLRDENDIAVLFDDNTEGTLTEEDVWRMVGEDSDDGILKEKEVSILQSAYSKCIVSHVPEKGLVHIYKHLSSDKIPAIKTSKEVAYIDEQTDNGGTVKTVVQLPHPVDLSKCVDGVMDVENWLRLTYTQAQE